jgi:hypothetical protein
MAVVAVALAVDRGAERVADGELVTDETDRRLGDVLVLGGL